MVHDQRITSNRSESATSDRLIIITAREAAGDEFLEVCSLGSNSDALGDGVRWAMVHFVEMAKALVDTVVNAQMENRARRANVCAMHWRELQLRAGVPYGRNEPNGVTLHDLRRTLGSWQARTGASLAIIGKSLNHKSQQATAIYARLDLDPVRASVNTATAAMMEAGGMKEAVEVVTMPKRGAA